LLTPLLYSFSETWEWLHPTPYNAAETHNLLDKAEKAVEWYSVKPKLAVHSAAQSPPSEREKSVGIG
jgi:hypothetical protein